MSGVLLNGYLEFHYTSRASLLKLSKETFSKNNKSSWFLLRNFFFFIIQIVSNYSSALTTSDGLYTRPGGSSSSYYYEAVQLVVDTTGTYDISSVSGMDTLGYLYNGTFYPTNPSQNLIAQNDDGAPNNQFKLPVHLIAGVPYTVVLSTHPSQLTGPFSIVTSGPGNAQYFPINTFETTSE